MTSTGEHRSPLLFPLGRGNRALGVLVLLSVVFGWSHTAISAACTPGQTTLLVERPADLSDGNEIDQRRQQFLEREAAAIFKGSAEAVGACNFRLTLTLDRPASDIEDLSKQSFRIESDDRSAAVVAPSTLGLVYGFYEVLDRLGVRFISPNQTLLPELVDWQLIPARLHVAPRVEHRGFWTFGEGLDREFLLWAGRNRFNVVGGEFGDGEGLRELFAIARWGGGHDVISTLTPTNQAVDGTMLAEVHPEWFGSKASPNSIPFGKHSYRNPCFGDEGYADFFRSRLDAKLAEDRYSGDDFINIWPSDSPALLVDSACRRPEGSDGALDDLLYFYTRLAADQPDRAAEAGDDRPTIAGIGYYGSYDVSSANAELAPAPAEDGYLHIFYNNVRSYRVGFFNGQSDLNRQFATMLERSVTTLGYGRFGIVDYHNYSLYSGMLSANLRTLQAELERFDDLGMSFYAYMHPNLRQTIPEMLLNRMISRMTFNGDGTEELFRDFVRRYFGGDQAAADALEALDVVLSNRAEMFGPESSLSLILLSEIVYAEPPLGSAEIAGLAKALLDGTPVDLPVIRVGLVEPFRSSSPGLVALIEMLKRAEDGLRRHSVGGDAQQERRKETLAQEIRRVRLIHEQLRHYAEAYLAAFEGRTEACVAEKGKFDKGLAALDEMEWPEYISRMSGFETRSSYLDRQKTFRAHLETELCD